MLERLREDLIILPLWVKQTSREGQEGSFKRGEGNRL